MVPLFPIVAYKFSIFLFCRIEIDWKGHSFIMSQLTRKLRKQNNECQLFFFPPLSFQTSKSRGSDKKRERRLSVVVFRSCPWSPFWSCCADAWTHTSIQLPHIWNSGVVSLVLHEKQQKTNFGFRTQCGFTDFSRLGLWKIAALGLKFSLASGVFQGKWWIWRLICLCCLLRLPHQLLGSQNHQSECRNALQGRGGMRHKRRQWEQPTVWMSSGLCVFSCFHHHVYKEGDGRHLCLPLVTKCLLVL